MPPRRSLEVDKRSSAPYLFLGLAEIMIRDYEGSEEHLLKAFEIGEPAVAHIYLANLYEQLGEPTKSIEQLQAFLRENLVAQLDTNQGSIEKLKRQNAKN